MSRRVDKIKGNTEERRKRSKIHPHFVVHDHCFMPDRLHIDIHVSAQKMFRLRIIGTAEHFLNKNLRAACRDEHPKKYAQRQGERQKPGSRGRTQRELTYFLNSSAPFLSA